MTMSDLLRYVPPENAVYRGQHHVHFIYSLYLIYLICQS
jgi:hypothetical protein